MILDPRRLYEIRDRATGHVMFCYPERPLNLATMFTPGVRTDEGYEIRTGDKLIAEVTKAGLIQAASTGEQ